MSQSDCIKSKSISLCVTAGCTHIATLMMCVLARMERYRETSEVNSLGDFLFPYTILALLSFHTMS